ncbi:MAG: TetR/AcrR family transcriptional regulator, partial [Acidimicrobiales bacterium]
MPYRPTDRTRAKQAERHATLLATAERLVAAEGFGAASIVAVASAAGMSAGAVYSHFSGKSELLAAVFRRAADRELAAVRDAVQAADRNATARLSALIEVFAGRALQGRTLAWALLAEPVDPLVDAERLTYRRAYREIAADVLRQGIDDGDLPAQDIRLSAAALIGAISEALVGPLSPVAARTRADEFIPALQTLC